MAAKLRKSDDSLERPVKRQTKQTTNEKENKMNKLNTLILSNDKGQVHITKCVSKRDALSLVSWLEKNEGQKIVSVIIVNPDGSRDQVRGGGF